MFVACPKSACKTYNRSKSMAASWTSTELTSNTLKLTASLSLGLYFLACLGEILAGLIGANQTAC